MMEMGNSQCLPRHPSLKSHCSGTGILGQWKAEAVLPLLRPILLCMLLGVLILGALKWRDVSSRSQSADASAPAIVKEPVNFINRTFDPAMPPSDMPPLNSEERAECDSDFLSNAKVGGQTRQIDETRGIVTVRQIKVTLQLNVTIWVPTGASQHVIEHEAGHRQISEFYYQIADQFAERIASSYMGKQIEIEGADLNAESNKALQQIAAEINEEYKRELNPEPTQLLYEAITDHGRNQVVAQDAAAHAIKNIRAESTQPASP
jgi:hypothetical protein